MTPNSDVIELPGLFIDGHPVIMDRDEFTKHYPTATREHPWRIAYESSGSSPAVVRQRHLHESGANDIDGQIRLAYLILDLPYHSDIGVTFRDGQKYNYCRSNLMPLNREERTQARVAAKAERKLQDIEIAKKRVIKLRKAQDKAVLPAHLSEELYRTEETLEKIGIII
jgi:hypothetical protein